MGACKTVKTKGTTLITIPLTKFVKGLKEVCDDVEVWMEEQGHNAETLVEQVGRVCKDWPWPLDWCCKAVTTLVKAVVWVVDAVAQWVVKTICHTITAIIGAIITFISVLVPWVGSFLVCLAEDPGIAISSIGDLWKGWVDFIEAIADIPPQLIDDTIDLIDDIDRVIDLIGNSLGWPFNIIVGIWKGLFKWVRRWLEIGRDFWVGWKQILVGVLLINLCGIARGGATIGGALGRGLLETGFAPVGLYAGGWGLAAVLLGIRAGGAIAGGIRDSIEVYTLQKIIEEKIGNAGFDPARKGRALEKVHLDSTYLGMPLRVDARRAFLRSTAAVPDLRDLHNRGVIDLYALGGYPSSCRSVINEPEGEVVYAGTELGVSATDIRLFLKEGPEAVPEFHVFAIRQKQFKQHLRVAQMKARTIGVQLHWDGVGMLEIKKPEWIPLNCSENDPPLAGEPGPQVQKDLMNTEFNRIGNFEDDLNILPALNHFHYIYVKKIELNGLTTTYRELDTKSSGVTYRSHAPDAVYRWVLIHEMGHYWGLRHEVGGDDTYERGYDEVMYRAGDGVSVNFSTVLEYLLLGGEPRFTIGDARTAWTWMTNDAKHSLLP
jgi:hypothetical protein